MIVNINIDDAIVDLIVERVLLGRAEITCSCGENIVLKSTQDDIRIHFQHLMNKDI